MRRLFTLAVRNALAIVGGAVVAFSVFFALDAFGTALFPLPPDLDFYDQRSVLTAMEGISSGLLGCMLVALAVGTFAGAWFAAWVSGSTPAMHAAVIGALVMLAVIGSMLVLPLPTWFCVASLILLLPSVYLGALLAMHTRGSALAREAVTWMATMFLFFFGMGFLRHGPWNALPPAVGAAAVALVLWGCHRLLLAVLRRRPLRSRLVRALAWLLVDESLNGRPFRVAEPRRGPDLGDEPSPRTS
jgi:hypothetical protein